MKSKISVAAALLATFVIAFSQSSEAKLASTSKGRIVAFLNWERSLILWDHAQGKILWGRKFKGGITATGLHSCDISPDESKIILTDRYNNKIYILNKNGKMIKSFSSKYKEAVSEAVFSPNGRFAVYVDGGSVFLVNMRSYKRKALLSASDSMHTVVDISGDSKLVAVGDSDDDLKIIDVGTGKILKILRGHKSRIHDVAFSRDGKFVASTDTGGVLVLWRVKDGKALYRIRPHPGGGYYEFPPVVFTDDSRFLIVGGHDQTVALIDVRTGKKVKDLFSSAGCVRSLDLSSSGEFLIISGPQPCYKAKYERVDVSRFSRKYRLALKKKYEAIKRKNDVNSYKSFLESYNDEYADYYAYHKKILEDARKRMRLAQADALRRVVGNEKSLQKLIDSPDFKEVRGGALDRLYALVEKADKIEKYVSFAERYPDSKYAKRAIVRIFGLVDRENNIAGYEWFVRKFPSAPESRKALQKIYALAFAKAKEINTIDSYNTFIFNYPMAPQVKEANRLAYVLEEKKYTDVGLFGIIGRQEKMERAARRILIKAKQIERYPRVHGIEDAKSGYIIVANRMYRLLEERFDDTEATLRYLESEEFKDFVSSFKEVMSDIRRTLQRIERGGSEASAYLKKLVEISSKGFAEAKVDRAMATYYAQQHREWEKRMHMLDKGYN